MNVSLTSDLQEHGLLVVRSSGGRITTAIELSNLLRDRHATVVVYDYCMSTCALFLLIASHQAYVLKESLVVWENFPRGAHGCTFVTVPPSGGATKLRRGPCGVGGDRAAFEWPMLKQFFVGRAVSPLFEAPPDSPYVREELKKRYAESGVDRDIGWTINPRYDVELFTSRITYEAYPESQAEVDRIRARLGLKLQVIYDP